MNEGRRGLRVSSPKLKPPDRDFWSRNEVSEAFWGRWRDETGVIAQVRSSEVLHQEYYEEDDVVGRLSWDDRYDEVW